MIEVSPHYAPLIGLIVYVAVTVATVPVAMASLVVAIATDYTTREATAGVAGLITVAGGGWFTYHIVALNTSLETAVGVALTTLAGVFLLWVLPVGVGTWVLSATDAGSPLKYALVGWPVATLSPLAYIAVFSPPATFLITAAVVAIPVIGTPIIGNAVARLAR